MKGVSFGADEHWRYKCIILKMSYMWLADHPNLPNPEFQKKVDYDEIEEDHLHLGSTEPY